MTAPTIEQMIEWLQSISEYTRSVAPWSWEPSDAAMSEAIRKHLAAQSPNTLPLDEVPAGWMFGKLIKIAADRYSAYIRRSEREVHKVYGIYGEGNTPSEALRAAIAKVKTL